MTLKGLLLIALSCLMRLNAQPYKYYQSYDIGALPSGVLDTQSFSLYEFRHSAIEHYRFRSGCGCVSMRWDSVKSKTCKVPVIEFIYNSSGNEGEIDRYGVVYLMRDTLIDSVRLTIHARVVKTKLSAKALQNQYLKAALFDSTHRNMGTVFEGQQLTLVFSFRNTGSVPIVIVQHESSCGCCFPSYSKEPVLPGKSGEVKVHFNSSGKVGVNNKTVAVIFSNGQRVELGIKVNVVERPLEPEERR